LTQESKEKWISKRLDRFWGEEEIVKVAPRRVYDFGKYLLMGVH